MDHVRRRNSILKTENDATPTKTMTKNKRISFSGKNSVKEFIEGNDKHTIWGTSYEKEMEAMQKQGDSIIPSQTDISAYDSTAINSIASNKENLPDAKSIRMSYALLDCDNISNSICPNMDSTALHILPHDNLGSDTVVGQLFQMPQLVENRLQQSRMAEVASTTNLNQTAMEVSMMWQDILSQTKEAGGISKTSSRMGNTINLAKETETRAPLAARQTIYYNGQTDGEMEIEKTVLQKTIYYQTTNDDMDESGFKIPPATNTQQRSVQHIPSEGHIERTTNMVVVAKNRQTIHFNDENAVLDESTMPQNYPPNPHQTIHFHADGSAMEESVLEVTKQTATRGRDSFFPGGNNDPSKGDLPKKRQTIHYPADGEAMDETVRPNMTESGDPAHMEESIVVDQRMTLGRKARDSCYIAPENKKNLIETHQITQTVASKNRQTIHFQAEDGNMDESQMHIQTTSDLPRNTATKISRQTIVFKEANAAMEESMQTCPNVRIVAGENDLLMQKRLLPPKSSRQSIHFTGSDGMMEESMMYPIPAPAKNTRQSIHFNEVNNGMDESLQIKAPIAQDNPVMHNEEIHRRKNNPRQTICFKPEEGCMDESVYPTRAQINPRQTINYRTEDAMEESVYQVTIPQAKSNRQTIHFNATEGVMEESRRVNLNPQEIECCAEQMDVDENAPAKIVAQRGTIHFQAQDGNMDESHIVDHLFVPKPVLPVDKIQSTIARQTVYYEDENGALEETKIAMEKENSEEQQPPLGVKSRQTIYDERQMDVSVSDNGHTTVQPPIAVQQRPIINSRQTVYYHDAGLDVTGAPAGQDLQMSNVTEQLNPPSRRCTIYYDQAGLEESKIAAPPRDKSVIQALPVQSTVIPKGRQTIYFDNADDAEMDESRHIMEMEKPMGPLERSMKLQTTNKSMTCIQSPLERSLMMQQSQKIEVQMNVDQESLKSPAAKLRKTIYYQQDAAMEESMQMPTGPHEAISAVERKEIKNPRGTIYTAARMEESIRAPIARRGTFNVPQEDSVIMDKFMPSSAMKNSTAFEIADDSMVSDLNNLEDSIELMDSRGKLCPVSASKYAPQMSYRSSKSPDLVNETVNDLNLNFNVTGQIILPKEKSEDQERTKNASKIPVRTPSKLKKSIARSDMFAVDVVRDASVIVPRSRLQEEALNREHTFVGPIKPDMRMSIPVLSVNNMEATMEPQCFGEMVEEDLSRLNNHPLKKSKRSRLEHRVDVEKFKTLDFGAAMERVKDLNYKVNKVCNTVLSEQTMYIPRLGSEISLKQETFDKAEAECQRRINKLENDQDWGCFPQCLPMEDMIKNLLESEHKNWRYQDLYYPMGFLKFRHRFVKTFQVVIKFSVDDDEFSRAHYLPFEKFTIVEDNLTHWSTVDQKMHKELMRSIPLGLVILYGTSIDLGRFLNDMDMLCRRIFKDIAC